MPNKQPYYHFPIIKNKSEQIGHWEPAQSLWKLMNERWIEGWYSWKGYFAMSKQLTRTQRQPTSSPAACLLGSPAIGRSSPCSSKLKARASCSWSSSSSAGDGCAWAMSEDAPPLPRPPNAARNIKIFFFTSHKSNSVMCAKSVNRMWQEYCPLLSPGRRPDIPLESGT